MEKSPLFSKKKEASPFFSAKNGDLSSLFGKNVFWGNNQKKYVKKIAILFSRRFLRPKFKNKLFRHVFQDETSCWRAFRRSKLERQVVGDMFHTVKPQCFWRIEISPPFWGDEIQKKTAEWVRFQKIGDIFLLFEKRFDAPNLENNNMFYKVKSLHFFGDGQCAEWGEPKLRNLHYIFLKTVLNVQIEKRSTCLYRVNSSFFGAWRFLPFFW